MDVNGDGNIDLLSGSYSRNGQPMAGLFQVLWGDDEGNFQKAQVLNGSDGEPLLLPGGDTDDTVIDVICTRPTACDLNGDGKLDIVAGNFRGTFYVFDGEGEGRFSPQARQLMAGDQPLSVAFHSDPFVVDWDGDGDLDLLSGTSNGGVYLAFNGGDAKNPAFGAFREVLEPCENAWAPHERVEQISSPGGSTRVFAADVDGDGKLDLLVGDSARIHRPADGLNHVQMREQLEAFEREQSAWMEKNPIDWETASEDEQAAYMDAMDEFRERRAAIVVDSGTGLVWLLRQK